MTSAHDQRDLYASLEEVLVQCKVFIAIHSSSSNRSHKKRHSNISTYSPPFSKPVSEMESDEQQQLYYL